MAGSIERRLCDGVRFRVEGEDELIAGFGGGVIGGEDQATLSDVDCDCIREDALGCQRQERNECRETHFEGGKLA